MKIKINKMKVIMILIVMMLMFLGSEVSAAASVQASAGKTTLNVGETTDLSITANGCAGMFSVTSSNSSVVSVSSGSSFVEGSSMETAITLTAKGAGTATITIKATDVTESELDANGEPVDFTGSTTVSITVKEVEKPAENNTNTNTNNNTNTNTNTNTNNSQNTNTNTNQQQPQQPTVTYQAVNDTVYAKSNLNIRKEPSTSSEIIGSLSKDESITRTGIGSNGWDKVTYNGQTAYVNHAYVTTEEPVKEEEEETKSSNKALESLSIEGYVLDPEFNPETTKYTINLNPEDEELKITAKTADEKAKYEITENGNFKVGNNLVKITVTAEDETVRIYTITVIKEEEVVVESLKLATLEISNATLQPTFSPDITKYTIEVEDPSTITKESIIATSLDPDVTITVAESELSENGEKEFTVMLEKEDGQQSGVYQITVKKPTKNIMETVTTSKDNSIYYILGGVIAGLVVLIIIIIIALNKTSDKEDSEEEDNYNEESNNNLSTTYDNSIKQTIDELKEEKTEGTSDFDRMVKQSELNTQILNNKVEDKDEIEMTKKINYSDVSEDYTNTNTKKKGKHF